MNQYRAPNEWTDVLNESVDKSRGAAKKFQLSGKWSAISEPIQDAIGKLKQLRIGDTFRDFYYRFQGLEKQVRLLIGGVAAVLMLTLLVTSTRGSFFGSRTWEGTWTNLSYNSGGTLTCVAREVEPGEWEGTFTGVWQGDPFKYKVRFSAKQGRGESLSLSGTADIDDHNYKWTGMMRGKTFRGRYNSTIGYQGEFVMNEK